MDEREREYQKILDDALLKAAGTVAHEEMLREFEEAASDESIPVPDASELLREIHAKEQRLIGRKRLRRGVVRYGKIAAVFVIAAGVTFGGLFVGVSAFRTRVLNFVYSRQETHTDLIRYDEFDGERVEMPENWPYPYFPKWVPEGFGIDAVEVSEYSGSCWFVNDMGQTIIFSVNKKISSPSVDTENMLSEQIEILGHPAMLNVSEDDLYSSLHIMLDENMLVSVIGNISKTEIVQVADQIF